MKNKTIALVALSLILAFSFMNVAAYADTTLATVAFESGTLEFGDAGLSNMDIDFGTQSLPVGPSAYVAEDGDHTLRVLDARASAGSWSVTVELSAFTSVTPSVSNTFDGTITMSTPDTTDGLTAAASLVIYSAASAIDVVTAAPSLRNGTYDTTWAETDIEMSIGTIAAATITEEAAYEAVMTWTLAVY